MKSIPDSGGSARLRRYARRWQIGRNETLHVWTAERHEGTAVRYIVARTPAELAARLATAERPAS